MQWFTTESKRLKVRVDATSFIEGNLRTSFFRVNKEILRVLVSRLQLDILVVDDLQFRKSFHSLWELQVAFHLWITMRWSCSVVEAYGMSITERISAMSPVSTLGWLGMSTENKSNSRDSDRERAVREIRLHNSQINFATNLSARFGRTPAKWQGKWQPCVNREWSCSRRALHLYGDRSCGVWHFSYYIRHCLLY